jgi:hypothetical protein
MKLRLCLIVFVNVAAVLAASWKIDHEMPYEPVSGRTPVWNGGALISIEKDDSATPVIHLRTDRANARTPYVFSVAEANVIRVYGVARGSDGTLALAGIMHDKEGRGSGYIALIPPDRVGMRLIRTFPYVPFYITMGSGGSVWTAGIELVNGHEEDPLIDRARGALRHFDSSGKLIASLVPVSSMAVLDLDSGINALASSRDSVGFFSRHAAAYFEVQPDGQLKRYAGIELGWFPVIGLTLTDNGEAYLSATTRDGPANLYRLDRAKNTWVHVSLPEEIAGFQNMYGGDGNQLALQLKRPMVTFVTAAQ